MTRQPIEVAFERRGDGSPLVLLHGIGHRWQAWEPVLDRLAGSHDVIAVDLPGFGSSPLLADGRGYDMPSAVDTCADIFADLGLDRPHVAGNSLGGVIALELASRGLVSSATALAPAGFWTRRDRAWALWVLRMIRLSGRLPAGSLLLRRRYFRMVAGGLLYGHPSRMTAEIMLADLVSMVGSPAFDLVAAAGRDYTFAAPAPRVPVAVAWGTKGPDPVAAAGPPGGGTPAAGPARVAAPVRARPDDRRAGPGGLVDHRHLRGRVLGGGGLTSRPVEVGQSGPWKIVCWLC